MNARCFSTWVRLEILGRSHSQIRGSLYTAKSLVRYNQMSENCISTVTEGTATVKVPKGEVFYNPVQQFNRDLSISVISTFSKLYLSDKKKRHLQGLTILEALSATGLRSIRYAKEIPGFKKVIANDLDAAAVEAIKENIRANSADCPELLEYIQPNQGDATLEMFRLRAAGTIPDVIDIDPYGSAAPFIDAAVQNVANGGLLCVTCTDLAVLCATYPETCFAKYGGLPIRGDVCHEAVYMHISLSFKL